ncbi:MAG: A/G-specific adenine glycosylase [Mogibacterium sp.]|nr:A/G-specific adenine glycosylase [Mogibacterium sp.]
MDISIGKKTDDLAGILLEWYDSNRRILPWREDPSPYHVWISEIMLQQTRVEAVRGYYARFLEALPTIESLAEADEDLCAKLWQGLGYYSRVRNLHRAAIRIVDEYGGVMPQTVAELTKLPGIGPYTAAAIASICFDERIPAIDGNLLRVFSRMTGYDQDIRSGAAKSAAQAFYEELFPQERCGDLNQALMDLGAGICLPNGAPHCEDCPWQEHCRARSDGTCQQLPVVLPKAKRKIEQKTVFLIYYQGRLVLRRRPEKGLLAGLYEYPNADGTMTAEDILSYLRTLGFSAVRYRSLPEATHIFTHREWHMTGWEILADEWEEFASGEPREHELFLVTASDLQDVYSIPSAFSKYTEQIRTDYLKLSRG